MDMAWRLFPGSWMDALIMIHGKLIALLVCFQPDAGPGSRPQSESAWISSFNVIDNPSPIPPSLLVSTVSILLSMLGISTSMGVSINARHRPSSPLIVYSLVAERQSM
ncbi:hypothetical protein BDV09DRAFT_189923 [Aspergillus tetrazonus]